MPTTTRANQLASLRRSAGITQQQLAASADLSIGTIRNLEQGVSELLNTELRTALAIARALHVSVEDLLEVQKRAGD